MNTPVETLWHITVLSNFARGFDKYTRTYSKAAIPESTYPDRFFLLKETEIGIGMKKAAALLEKLSLPGNRLIALQTHIPATDLRANTNTGLGRYIESGTIRLGGIAFIEGAGATRLVSTTTEEATALSLRICQPELADYETLRPRTFSVLPIARGCQANCPFCFSEASASAEQAQATLDSDRILRLADAARQRGAERFVITGGGEPGLLKHDLLCRLITAGSTRFDKTVLITNGHHLAKATEEDRAAMFNDYGRAGLRVLSISRHHHDDGVCAKLMSLNTDVAAIATTWRSMGDRTKMPTLRFTCVLQRGGVDSEAAIARYLDWAGGLGVEEICFKELYVSTSAESVYYRHAANAWSHAHQAPLTLVLAFAKLHDFSEQSRLPWGSPVFEGKWRGRPMRIAAYTEPSLFWERANGLARSWNLMADGRCLVSLEDRASEIQLAV